MSETNCVRFPVNLIYFVSGSCSGLAPQGSNRRVKTTGRENTVKVAMFFLWASHLVVPHAVSVGVTPSSPRQTGNGSNPGTGTGNRLHVLEISGLVSDRGRARTFV